LCSSWKEVFLLLGHEVRFHLRAFDALADVKAILSTEVVISDFYLPDINGIELIQRIREHNPELRAFLLTGSRDEAVLDAAHRLPNCVVLHKPVNIEDIEAQLSLMIPAA
jgi:two-component system phosphoglycerate transport system response regulator PgtA